MRKQNGIYLFTHFLTAWLLGEIFYTFNFKVYVSFSVVILGWNLSSCLTLDSSDSTQRNNFRKYVKGKKFPTAPNSLKCSLDKSKLN